MLVNITYVNVDVLISNRSIYTPGIGTPCIQSHPVQREFSALSPADAIHNPAFIIPSLSAEWTWTLKWEVCPTLYTHSELCQPNKCELFTCGSTKFLVWGKWKRSILSTFSVPMHWSCDCKSVYNGSEWPSVGLDKHHNVPTCGSCLLGWLWLGKAEQSLLSGCPNTDTNSFHTTICNIKKTICTKYIH